MEQTPTEQVPRPSRRGSAFKLAEESQYPGHLYFWKRDDWSGEPPEDQAELTVAFDTVDAVLRARFQSQDQQRFRPYFERLLKLAESVFNGPDVRTGMASRGLEQFKTELVQTEGLRIHHEYLRKLAAAAFKATILLLVRVIVIHVAVYYAELSGWIITSEVENSQQKDATEAAKPNQKKQLATNGIRWDKDFSILHFGILLIGQYGVSGYLSALEIWI
jgi:hypothetical protein